jgi:hypothetical protein
MAKIVVARNQQEEMRRLHPKPVYSRVINLTLQIPAGMGEGDFAVSPPVGGRIWLLNVKLHTMSQTRANVFGGFIYISTGTDKKVDGSIIAVKWDPVIRNYGGPKPGLYYTGFGDSYSWDMMSFFEGAGRRFGAMAENLFPDETWRAWISFEISEG